MQAFNELGKLIHAKWERLNFDIELFPSVAEDALHSFDARQIDLDEIYSWIFYSDNFIGQVNIDSNFGEPPIAVFGTNKFFIELLFWFSGTTAIHQHSFRGAFHVISGSSIHTHYTFDEKHRINEHLKFGDLVPSKIEFLEQNAFRRIEGGSSFIHSLFHLEHPSVSMVIRTINDPENSIQYEYGRPHIAIDYRGRDHRTTRQTQFLRMLRNSNHPKFETYLTDFAKAYNLYPVLDVILNFTHQGIIDGTLEIKLMTILENRFGDLTKYIRPVLSEIRRIAAIKLARTTVIDPIHRFFIALLMNATTKEQITSLVSSRFPSEKAGDLIFGWIKELNEQNKFNGKFDPFQLQLINLMIQHDSFEEIVEQLKTMYNRSEIDDSINRILKLYKSIESLPILQTLFNNQMVPNLLKTADEMQ